MNPLSRHPVGVSFLLALVLRIGFVLYADHAPLAIRLDGLQYQQIAVNLIAGTGFAAADGHPTALASPGQPLFLAAVYGLAGPSNLAATMVQAILSALTVAVVLVVFRHLLPAWRESTLAVGLILSLHPHLVYYAGVTMSETLFIFLVAILMLTLARFDQALSPGLIAAAGLICGISLLTRANLVLFVPVILAWLWLVIPGSGKARATWSLLFLLGLGIAMIPWIARNALVMKAFIPLTTRGAHSFFTRGYNPFTPAEEAAMVRDMAATRRACVERNLAGEPALSAFREFLGFDPAGLARWYPEPYRSQFSRLNEVEGQRLYNHLVSRTMREHPAKIARLVAANARHFWDIFGDQIPDGRRLNGFWVFFLPAILVGIIAAIRDWRANFLLFGLILSFFGLFTIAGAESRYRLPLEPFMMLYVPWGWSRISEKLTRPLAAVAVVAWAGLILAAMVWSDEVRQQLAALFL